MHSPVVVKQVHELKDTQKGVELMCHEMEKIYSEGMESGELKKAKETALSMAEKGMDVIIQENHDHPVTVSFLCIWRSCKQGFHILVLNDLFFLFWFLQKGYMRCR